MFVFQDYRIQVSIHASSTAEIYLPATGAWQATVYGLPLSVSDDAAVAGFASGKLKIRTGSGNCRFDLKIEN
jgi:hypothetical protein